jgi:GNAT superfamily N-acetyltransferase
MAKTPRIHVEPLTADRWSDLETLFGHNGAYAGCWCMHWRMDRASFKALKGDGTRQALHAMTESGHVTGVLAYRDGDAIGWCSIGPRHEYAALESSRILKQIDDAPVWSIVCFFVKKLARQTGVMRALVDGAVAHARANGATIIEAYPLDLSSPPLVGQTLHGYAGYMGFVSVFERAGFAVVARASETQVIMRRTLPPFKRARSGV